MFFFKVLTEVLNYFVKISTTSGTHFFMTVYLELFLFFLFLPILECLLLLFTCFVNVLLFFFCLLS